MRRYYDCLGIPPNPDPTNSNENPNSEAGRTPPSSDFPQPHFVTNTLNQAPSTTTSPREASDLDIADLGLADLAFAMELDNEGQDEVGEKYYVPAKFGPKKGDSSQGR